MEAAVMVLMRVRETKEFEFGDVVVLEEIECSSRGRVVAVDHRPTTTGELQNDRLTNSRAEAVKLETPGNGDGIRVCQCRRQTPF
jgi:hypothetical protein